VAKTVIGGGVVTEAVVDYPSLIILACPDQWVSEALVVVFVQNRDIGLGF
jgi:hypothetical protein